MELDQALTRVSVLGASGKMGRGISLLLLQEMARLQAEKEGRVGTGSYRLHLIDMNESSFSSLRHYLHKQMFKYAEKNINLLRKYFSSNVALVSNEEIILAFVSGAMDLVIFSSEVEAAKDSWLIFEAILEDVKVKGEVFRKIVAKGNQNGLFLSNTSSIPIHILNEQAELNHRLIGFHFYNPPVIQKLLEIIVPNGVNPEFIHLTEQLAKRLQKTIVFSQDVAGFIGNGHMIREIAFASKQVEKLSQEYPLEQAIYMVNRVTQEWLMRPMGIFQLMDYVGLDVCQHISRMMETYLHDPSLRSSLIDKVLKKGILGGQNTDGTQKNGFFSYNKHLLTGIYNLGKETYIPFTEASWIVTADRALGGLPKGHLPWKLMQKEQRREEIFTRYFENLHQENTLGAQLAKEFLLNSKNISEELLENKIASSSHDIDTVLKNGFYHLYGANRPFQEVHK